jgi:hypothetical protein
LSLLWNPAHKGGSDPSSRLHTVVKPKNREPRTTQSALYEFLVGLAVTTYLLQGMYAAIARVNVAADYDDPFAHGIGRSPSRRDGGFTNPDQTVIPNDYAGMDLVT